MTLKKKLVITVILGTLLVLLYMAIFHFSAQNGETSSNLSGSVLRKIIDWIRMLLGGNLSEQSADMMSQGGELLLRKAVHFSEYAVIGILTMGILSCYLKKGKAYLLAVIWVFLSAVLDEWHQSFIPGRCARAFDVLIDTLGGMTGAVLCICFLYLIHKKTNKNNKNTGY